MAASGLVRGTLTCKSAMPSPRWTTRYIAFPACLAMRTPKPFASSRASASLAAFTRIFRAYDSSGPGMPFSVTAPREAMCRRAAGAIGSEPERSSTQYLPSRVRAGSAASAMLRKPVTIRAGGSIVIALKGTDRGIHILQSLHAAATDIGIVFLLYDALQKANHVVVGMRGERVHGRYAHARVIVMHQHLRQNLAHIRIAGERFQAVQRLQTHAGIRVFRNAVEEQLADRRRIRMTLQEIDRFPTHAGIILIVRGSQHQALNVGVVQLSGDYPPAGFIEHDLHFAGLAAFVCRLHGANGRDDVGCQGSETERARGARCCQPRCYETERQQFARAQRHPPRSKRRKPCAKGGERRLVKRPISNRPQAGSMPHKGALAIDGAHEVMPAFGQQGGGWLRFAPVERGGQDALRLRLASAGRTSI